MRSRVGMEHDDFMAKLVAFGFWVGFGLPSGRMGRSPFGADGGLVAERFVAVNRRFRLLRRTGVRG